MQHRVTPCNKVLIHLFIIPPMLTVCLFWAQHLAGSGDTGLYCVSDSSGPRRWGRKLPLKGRGQGRFPQGAGLEQVKEG